MTTPTAHGIPNQLAGCDVGAADLRADERWQWGVKHSQGIRQESSEASARHALAWMLEGHKRSRPGTPAPYLVRRRVSEWQTVAGGSERAS